jgi:hypothetical protein
MLIGAASAQTHAAVRFALQALSSERTMPLRILMIFGSKTA